MFIGVFNVLVHCAYSLHSIVSKKMCKDMSRDHGSRVLTVTLRNDEFVFGPVRHTKALFRKEADPI